MAPSSSRTGSSEPRRAPLGDSGLPLIQCPFCGQARVLELTAKTEGHYNERFFKCPRKYTMFPLCDFYMFEEEYANYLVNMGLIPESMMCHYQPLEREDNVEETMQSEINEVLEPANKGKGCQRNVVRSKKKGKRGKQGSMQIMMCIGVAVLVLLGINSIILLVLVLLQMSK